MKRNAFTLIELLVVIAIIAILAAILFPVFAQAKMAAKRTGDLSNVKQLVLGCIQYIGDSDEFAPLYQQTPNGKVEYTPGMFSWKDNVSPYVKSGGQPYNDGQKYSQRSGGGVYESPLAESPWSSVSVKATPSGGWPGGEYADMNGGTGDATTRFARSYAMNQFIGANETGFFTAITTATKEMPDGSVTYPHSGKPGSTMVLQNPANTLLIVPTRTYMLAVNSTIMYGTCTADGFPTTSPLSCIRGNGNRCLTGGFMDGHAKSINGPQTIRQDMWDNEAAFDALIHQPVGTSAQGDAQAAQKVKEWGG